MKKVQMSYLAVGVKGSANRSVPFSQRAAPLYKKCMKGERQKVNS